MTEQRYKFLRISDAGEITSDSGAITWQLDEWQEIDGALALCERGFHCSQRLYHAFGYVQGEIMAVVEVDGESVAAREGDKEAWSRMRLLKAYQWRKEDSVALSIFAAEGVLAHFENLYPYDKRPRQAIEAARKWRQEPTEENQSIAWSAWSAAGSAAESATRSARSAAWSALLAAWSAAESARSAAWSAGSAAGSAAESAGSAARSAVWAARSAAWSAAGSGIEANIEDWMHAHLACMVKYVPLAVEEK